MDSRLRNVCLNQPMTLRVNVMHLNVIDKMLQKLSKVISAFFFQKINKISVYNQISLLSTILHSFVARLTFCIFNRRNQVLLFYLFYLFYTIYVFLNFLFYQRMLIFVIFLSLSRYFLCSLRINLNSLTYRKQIKQLKKGIYVIKL